MRVLVTGIAGFIGSSLARTLLRKGYDVVGVDDLSTGYLENIPSGADFYELDVNSILDNVGAVGSVDFICHLAGQSSGEISFEDPAGDLRRNACSTLSLIGYGLKVQAKKILYASSMSVYGSYSSPIKESPEDFQLQPLSCYGVSKLASEQYLRIFSGKIPFVSLRMFNVYGSGQDMANLRQGMVSIFLSQAMCSDEICVKGPLDRVRDFVHVNDVVDVWITAMEASDLKNEILNVGTGVPTSVEMLLEHITSQTGPRKVVLSAKTEGDQSYAVANIDKLATLVDVSKFLDLSDGIRQFYESLTNDS
jgi:UDP-glucose 4-epimerase